MLFASSARNFVRHSITHSYLHGEALPKLAIFLQMLEHLQAGRDERTTEIYLPMGRTDISEYVGMSLAAVSRAFRTLEARGILEARDRRHVKIKDRAAFEELAG